ncbi:unnamed protein product [Ixodes hexagonus]
MMVQMSPRVRREFPSTMSCEPRFSRWTLCSLRNVKALSTFSRQWIFILPLVGFCCRGGTWGNTRISRSLMSILPSRMSIVRSVMRQLARTR